MVSGRVQGVFFRASARQRATELGLTGYVKNLPDGRVEAVACGPAGAIETFAAWLGHGPPRARVQAVTRAPAPDAAPYPDFRVA